MTSLSRLKKFALIAICLLATGFAGGCGGGGGGVSVGTLGGRAFDPNYVSDLKSLTHWPSFPVKVYFATDGLVSDAREALAVSGISRWNDVTGGQIRYTVTTDPAQAQLVVHFVDKLEGSLIGWTTWSYQSGGSIQHADTQIAVNGLSDSDITWVAAHEFGHALGIDGHSKSGDDVMFSTHTLGSQWSLTLRDENTVKTDYNWLFTGSPAPVEQRSSGPLFTTTIKCYGPVSH